MKRIVTYLLVLLGLLAVPGARAQTVPAEVGLPYVAAHYSPVVYGYHPQNWDVVQDSRGIVYVANNSGVLTFDGTRWRRIRLSTGTPFVRSLAVSAGDTVYVGARGDFGYLAPDSVGRMRFVSLRGEVAPEDRNFADVWGTHVTPEGAYFQARHRLFRWDGDTLRVWRSEAGFHTSFEVRETIYVRDMERGLVEVVGDSLHLVPGGARFADAAVFVMVPYGKGRILVGTQEAFFLYDGTAMEPYTLPAEAFLEGTRLYHGCALPSGYVALATLGRGVIIIDRGGEVVRVLDRTAELPDGVVNYVYAGRQGGLWMALNNEGVARAQVPAPLSYYGSEVGLKGIIYYIQRQEGTLYVGTGAGLYRLIRRPLSALARRGRERSVFEPVLGVPPTVRSLLSTETGLLAATDLGIYRVQDGAATQLVKEKVFALLASDYFDGTTFVGTKRGLAVLVQEGSDWRLHDVPGIDLDVWSMYEEEDGTLWLASVQGAVLRVRFTNGLNGAPQVTRYGPADGLPSGWIYVSGLFDEVVVGAEQGIYHPVPAEGGLHFVRDPELSASSGARQGALLTFAQNGNSAWLAYEQWIDRVVRQGDGSFKRMRPPALNFPKADIVRLYAEDSGIVWIGNGDELVRYDRSLPATYNVRFPMLIRRISTVGRHEDVVFGGTRLPGEAQVDRALDYGMNDLRFTFAMPEYSTVTRNRYQYKLEGVDDGWSDWQRTTSVTYTNLFEGDYRFMVRGRNERGRVSEVAVFSFRILPPWYRTWWAYSLYVAAVVLGVLGARHYRHIMEENRRARMQAAALARERAANERLKEANEELERANNLKDTFLANTSHELRTPLTAILGFTEVMQEETSNEEHREFLGIIEDNGRRLLDTLNALLDIAKIRAGMKLVERGPVDVCEKTREATRLLRSLADRKELQLTTCIPDEALCAILNPGYFERILQNLIGNAIKFTEEGSVTVRVQALDDHVEVSVQDTGIGIEQDFLPYLFKEFKQESSGITRTHEGSGLGLAITARLVDIMDGTIRVESTKGEGTLFVVRFPRPIGTHERALA